MARTPAPLRGILRTLVWAYRRSGGRIHGTLFGVPVLLLTHRGRKSGRRMTIPLGYARDGDDFIVIASNGGSNDHPSWYLNLKAHPEAEVEVRRELVSVVARDVPAGAEKERLYKLLGDVYNGYYGYRTKTSRDIPVVRLAPSPK